MSARSIMGMRANGRHAQFTLPFAILLFCVLSFNWTVATILEAQTIALREPPAWIFEPLLANCTKLLFRDGVGKIWSSRPQLRLLHQHYRSHLVVLLPMHSPALNFVGSAISGPSQIGCLIQSHWHFPSA